VDSFVQHGDVLSVAQRHCGAAACRIWPINLHENAFSGQRFVPDDPPVADSLALFDGYQIAGHG
jgi:hypothetical protein